MKEAIEQFDFEPKLYTTTSFIINLNHGAIVFEYDLYSNIVLHVHQHMHFAQVHCCEKHLPDPRTKAL